MKSLYTDRGIKIPRDELFAPVPTGWQLPQWLQSYEDNFKDVMREGNTISNIIFGILERQLHLPSGTFSSCHRLTEPSHSFLRILRYPGLKEGKTLEKPRFFAHRDIVSIAILFTWVGGLQIPMENAEMMGPDLETEESWRWVEPLPGKAIVNLGDAMPIFTNGKLKSGKHRVVTAHGEQSKVDRCCVLVSTRPAHETPMRAFSSDVIPEDLPEKSKVEVMTSKQWGDNCVKVFIEEKVKGGS
jgi:isopenicillin N synthase-like dioxygenase